MRYWTTKDNKEILFEEMTDSHLINAIKFVEKRAKELDGEVIDGGGIDMDDIWYVEGSEKEWLVKLGHKYLIKEAKRRLIKEAKRRNLKINV